MLLIDLDEFQELGYLQEVNRLFFHPLGLALALALDFNDEGKRVFYGILDGRKDMEGFVFDEFTEEERVKAKCLRLEMGNRLELRHSSLGFGIQPC